MKTIRHFIEALQILAKYEKSGLDEAYFCQAEHDILYSNISVSAVSEEDARRLKNLGWHEDSAVDAWAYFT